MAVNRIGIAFALQQRRQETFKLRLRHHYIAAVQLKVFLTYVPEKFRIYLVQVRESVASPSTQASLIIRQR